MMFVAVQQSLRGWFSSCVVVLAWHWWMKGLGALGGGQGLLGQHVLLKQLLCGLHCINLSAHVCHGLQSSVCRRG